MPRVSVSYTHLDVYKRQELRVPFKSIRYRVGAVLNWGLQVVRNTQRNSYQDTWTVTSRGNAFGYEHTVTEGIISALHRSVQVSDTQSYEDLIAKIKEALDSTRDNRKRVTAAVAVYLSLIHI